MHWSNDTFNFPGGTYLLNWWKQGMCPTSLHAVEGDALPKVACRPEHSPYPAASGP